MGPVSKETVINSVKEYGLAWTTQDPRRIGRLFTKDAVYVERSFDRKATFRGRAAIEKYWKYQICGKQSNISFRHVDSEMVRDADQPIAVVKWLAEFDNRRENRGDDKAHKRVRFCQMAKLIFEDIEIDTEDGVKKTITKISYLEEYAQGVTGKSFRWPGIDASAEELWDGIRFEPPKPPPPVPCDECGELFASRTKLHAHIEFSDAVKLEDGAVKCIPNEKAKEKMRSDYVLVCLSIGYSCTDANEHLLAAWKNIVSSLNEKLDFYSDDINPPMTWAVPLECSSSATVNVVTMKVLRIYVEEIGVESLPKEFNTVLTQNGEKNDFVIVHNASIVSRPCAPERREYETYAAYIPWKYFDPKRAFEKSRVVYKLRNREQTRETCEKWRIPIEETAAIEFVNYDITQKLKDGARLMKDFGNDDISDEKDDSIKTLKVRTCAMEEPLHHYCKITVSFRQNGRGEVQRLIGLLLAFTRSDITEETFLSALKDRNLKITPLQGSYEVDDYPLACINMIEPAITRYENKSKIKLCRYGKTNVKLSDEMKQNLEDTDYRILDHILKSEELLQKWIHPDNKKGINF